MDKDRIKGKVKDIAGRAERQAGEWTGSEEHQAKGLGKQVEGKIQNTVGKVKDAVKGDRERGLDPDIDRDERVERGMPPRRKTA
jgi:uncharacterized protein YjbJ (UPF0337 family)